ncbi:dCTP deaminase [Halophage HF1]|uniref:dCTP deaminase n=2 Tax=Haloferacalesvirus TaxID=2843389 RepID=Q8V6P6_9CAUD|nr:dCTP deaminase [Halorubrum phage HF2]NP_861645.1 dCTP deaminase [Halophage HF1]AAL54979.1 dCTP deaminase [Halorubrum phage HF2]AAO61356.1 dCTP deaminase [Halophage HF1]QIR31091.1 dCTP deaminase Dcd [Halorubrum virus Hardycor2]
MTVLSQHDIQRSISKGNLGAVRNGKKLAVEPASMDLHIGDELKIPSATGTVVVDEEETYPDYYERSIEYSLKPGDFALAHTEEMVTIPPDMVGVLHGRSSVGRLGLFIHNAGFIDPGFRGQITLELFNASNHPIQLKEGMRACQLAIHELKTMPDSAYSDENGNKYSDQTGATPSRLYEDFQ